MTCKNIKIGDHIQLYTDIYFGTVCFVLQYAGRVLREIFYWARPAPISRAI